MTGRRIKAAIAALRKANDWLENSLIGAFIGAIMIFAFWYVVSVSIWVFQ